MKKGRHWMVIARVQAGLTQDQLADMVGTNGASISLYETGKCTPRVPMAVKIANTLNFDHLRFYEDPSQQNTQ